MRNIPVYATVQDPVSDKVKMETNPAYQELPSKKAPRDPAYQELSSYSGRASVSNKNQLEMLTIMKTLSMIKMLL